MNKIFKQSFFLIKNLPIKSRTLITASSKTIQNNKIFLFDKYGSFRYESLISMSLNLKHQIEAEIKHGDKVAILCSNNYTYLISILAVWLANGVPIPMNKNLSASFIENCLTDSKTSLVIKSLDDFGYFKSLKTKSPIEELAGKLNIPLLKLNESDFYIQNIQCEKPISFQFILDTLNFTKSNENDSLVMYTSGSCGSAKGVLFTFSNLISYMETLIHCWKISSSDCFLNMLPLNHVHGLVYSLLLPFFIGAQVDLMPSFDPKHAWFKLVDQSNSINVLTAVPTVYARLIEFYKQDEHFKIAYRKERLKETISTKMRIIASASAPLNTKTFNNWFNLTGVRLIERYGQTEAGICLANSLNDSKTKKIAGHVGRPYGDVRVRLVELNSNYETTDRVLIESDSRKDQLFVDSLNCSVITGEIQVKGPMVFKGYLNNPTLNSETFTHDGWFKSGDIAEYLIKSKVYKIIGRLSVDIVKTGGYELSALDIEREILLHPYIDDVAVIGLKDEILGEKLCALLILKSDHKNSFDLDEFKRWCRLRFPKYSLPKVVKIVQKLYKNQLGKVNKYDLVRIHDQKDIYSKK